MIRLLLAFWLLLSPASAQQAPVEGHVSPIRVAGNRRTAEAAGRAGIPPSAGGALAPGQVRRPGVALMDVHFPPRLPG